jgi:hypothetical protein
MNMKYVINFDSSNVMELGGGNHPLFHPNLDITQSPTVDIQTNLEELGRWRKVAHVSGKYDGIYGSYVIEHISWRNIREFIEAVFYLLKDNGKAVFLTANLLKQCELLISEGVNEKTNEMIFGSQEFPHHAGCHKTGFSPEYAKQLFGEAGFGYVAIHAPMPDVYVFKQSIIHPVYPGSETDMIIEAVK